MDAWPKAHQPMVACGGLWRPMAAKSSPKVNQPVAPCGAVQRPVAACGVLCRSWCNVVQCVACEVCVVPVVHVRWSARDLAGCSSCVLAGMSQRAAFHRSVLWFCAFVAAVCHCGRTALQPAHLRARGGQGIASVCCPGRTRARWSPARRVVAWPASVCWAR